MPARYNSPMVPILANPSRCSQPHAGGNSPLSLKRIAIGAFHPRFCDPCGHQPEPLGPGVHVERVVCQSKRYAQLRTPRGSARGFPVPQRGQEDGWQCFVARELHAQRRREAGEDLLLRLLFWYHPGIQRQEPGVEFGGREGLFEGLDGPRPELVRQGASEDAPAKAVGLVLARGCGNQFQHAFPPNCRVRGVVRTVQEEQGVRASVFEAVLDAPPWNDRGRAGVFGTERWV